MVSLAKTCLALLILPPLKYLDCRHASPYVPVIVLCTVIWLKWILLTSNSFPSSFHIRLSTFLYWRIEHKDFNKFQVSFNVHILFLSPSSCVEQRLVILPNHDDSHEHVAFCPASPMCTRSSCTHTQPMSLPFANSLWSRLPVVKCLRNSRM